LASRKNRSDGEIRLRVSVTPSLKEEAANRLEAAFGGGF
jgi:hypothetical protein